MQGSGLRLWGGQDLCVCCCSGFRVWGFCGLGFRVRGVDKGRWAWDSGFGRLGRRA